MAIVYYIVNLILNFHLFHFILHCALLFIQCV